MLRSCNEIMRRGQKGGVAFKQNYLASCCSSWVLDSLQAIYVPADDLTDPAPATTFAHLDATTVLSRAIAELGIYPAVDPLDSTSRIMDPNIVGNEHYDVARGVQKILQVSTAGEISDQKVIQGVYGYYIKTKAFLVTCVICFGAKRRPAVSIKEY